MSDDNSYQDGSERGSNDESGDEESDDDDNSFDYGFMGDDEDDEDVECDIDYTDMNVSPEILRMLGASEEVIAAKEAEISGIEWVAPTVTGLEHSSAIADFNQVALGRDNAGEGVARVFKGVGGFDKAKENGVLPSDTSPPEARSQQDKVTGETSPVLKLKITDAPQPVPKEKEFKLPTPKVDSVVGSDSGSDTSWDEASMIDGHGWWETAEGEDLDEECSARMSPNLRKALGLTTHAESATQGATGEAMGSDWRPPTFSGLDNSEPLTYLKPLAVGQRKGLEVRQAGSGSADGEESDEEGWDFEDVPDDEYILDWSTNISPNLANAIGSDRTSRRRSQVLSQEISWKPPSFYGLSNSAPLLEI